MGAGHGHIAKLLDRLAAAAEGLGDSLVAIGLDAIPPRSGKMTPLSIANPGA
jgi:hypothetical protein